MNVLSSCDIVTSHDNGATNIVIHEFNGSETLWIILTTGTLGHV